MWGFTKVGVPYWGPNYPAYQGILLFGSLYSGSLIFVKPHIRVPKTIVIPCGVLEQKCPSCISGEMWRSISHGLGLRNSFKGLGV